MFDYQGRQTEWSWPAFCVQQFLAPVGTLIVGGCGVVALGNFIEAAPTILRVVARVVSYGLPLFAGYVLGYGVQRCWQSSYRTGQWVWVAPVSLFLFAVLFDLRRDPSSTFSTFFSTNGPEQGLNLIFFTYPALGSCLYSIGTALEQRRSGR